MRNDSVGFFWDDTPPPKAPKKEQVKRTPPDPVWLRPDYLPGLDEALRFPVEIMTIEDLVTARVERQELVHDVETYPNYWLSVFTNMKTGKIVYFEMYDGHPLDVQKLRWVMESFTIVSFNGINYDLPITELAVHGLSCEKLKEASDRIIVMEERGSDVRRSYKAKALKVDHIDLIEVAPLFASLKSYAGRMHCHKMQDLPVHPSTFLTDAQRAIVKWYCVNDTSNTAWLRMYLDEHIELRYEMSNEYKVDLRSKSDAQIAEAVMLAELKRRTGITPKKPEIAVGTTYKYKAPAWIKFKSPLLKWALQVIENANFVVDHTGSVAMPQEVADLKLDINGSVYRMGIGGLHSSEKQTAHYTDSEYVLKDVDVTSFYPFLIMNQGLFPPHLGPIFLDVYRSIVMRRVAAKERGDSVIADSLKIVINGSFGKFGSKYSILYAPNFLIQTTVTGQLVLLMMIEMLEMAGIHVVSANTDGIVIKCHRSMTEVMDRIVKEWEEQTNLKTEETRYMALYSRDVNNYIAVKQKFDKKTKTWHEVADGIKTKGAYANPWSDKKNLAMRLHKNPTTTICVEAVEKYLTEGRALAATIRESQDITKFVSVRSVKGGAVKVWDKIPPQYDSTEELLAAAGYVKFADDSWTRAEYDRFGRYAVTTDKAIATAIELLSVDGPTEYVGKTVRWYYGKDIAGEMVYAKSGNKVPRSEGAVPCMVLPDAFPTNIDYDWYEEEAAKILVKIGAIPEPV